jgi:ribosome biogenesis GTPase
MNHVSDSNDVLSLPLPLPLLGWSSFFQQQLEAHPTPFEPARVTAGGRGVHHVLMTSGPRLATLAGRLLHEARDGADLPAVGDWVGVRAGAPDSPVTITHTLARRTCLLRKEAGNRTTAQVLAANVDTVLIVSALSAEFNVRRIERYVEAVLASGARPVFVLNKADLCDDPARFTDAVAAVAPAVPTIVASARSGDGLDALLALVREGETVALVGSSGVGKSSISNRLLGEHRQRERGVREHDDRGRHTTTHRELFLLPGGGLLIDTPGLREILPWASDEEVPRGFEDLLALAANCRFRDCAHEGEPGCAVLGALEGGALDSARLDSFRKLSAERRFLLEKQDVRKRHNEKRRFKEMTKMMRQHPKR